MLSAYNQFVVYRVVPSATRPGKTDKLPCDYRTGKVSDAHNPAIWTDSLTAQTTASQWGEGWGVGFVFTENDPFWFLDIDECLIDGQWSPLAQLLCGMLAGCAIEISQSGRGLHIFGSGKPPAHGCTNKALGLEFYHTGRFAALTGIGAMGDAATDATAVLPALVAAYFPADTPGSVEQVWTSEPDAEWNGPKDDAELIRRAMQSRSTAAAFGNKASFSDLWLANSDVLTKAYPDPNGRAYDCSAADAALAQHLAFWTGKDCERIQRLMQSSLLVREKWSREDYLPRTIRGAVGRQTEVLQDKPVAVGTPAPESAPLSEYINPEQQQAYFAGCIYVRSQHKALVPGGALMKPEQFKVHFGGHIFQMDARNEKTTRDAWEAWTQSNVRKPAMTDGICFRPDLPPASIVTISGQTFVNTYVPVPIARKQGDASRFIAHLAKVLPDERDRTILLSYMAACVQHQGVKFQWAPLLQGVEGNGKTLFARCVAEAVGRRYVHWPKASKLAKEFNSWMVGKVFFAVEDIYVPDGRREIIEELKPMITGGDGLEIEAKGVDQVSLDICGNFMFNSNHRDAIKKTENDRRFCVLYSAQQRAEDLSRDGMNGDYFPDLYNWLRDEGYAIVSELLWSYPIPAAMNPATECQRAPVTSSTAAAIGASAGMIEQEIEEAVHQGLQGFAGGWISTIWLDRLLERLGLARKISHYKRKEILEQMGYCYHPALNEGRVNNSVLPEGGKPRLFVHQSSMLMQITDAVAVAKNYESANTNRNAVALPFGHAR